MSDYVDFKAIKSKVKVEAVAARYGVELRRVNASHERGKCPLPGHPKGDTNETFSVNIEKQVWICHSAACAKTRKGKKGGDVIELVAAMENCSLREAGVKLGKWFSLSDASGETVEQPAKALPASSSELKVETPETSSGENFGVYAPLAEWINRRLESVPKSSLDETVKLGQTSAYVAVLAQIEELAASDYQTR